MIGASPIISQFKFHYYKKGPYQKPDRHGHKLWLLSQIGVIIINRCIRKEVLAEETYSGKFHEIYRTEIKLPMTGIAGFGLDYIRVTGSKPEFSLYKNRRLYDQVRRK